MNAKFKGVISDNIYKADIAVFVGGKTQEAVNWYAKKVGVTPWPLEESKNRYGYFGAYRPIKSGVIWLSRSNVCPSIIAHECFHATMYIFECLDIKAVDESKEEMFAYYLEWLMREVLKLK